MVVRASEKDERAGLHNAITGSIRRQMFFSIWFNQTYQGIQITLAYNISVYLVRHFSAGESEERIGQLTGILASAFSSAQFCTSYTWGLVTDKIGRKPVVVLANFIMGVATLGLGLAPTYWLAVVARCLGGAANGSGVAIKTMLAEACDATSQARGMAFLNLGWGMGNILGPMIGGFLSQPCDRWPNFPLCEDGQGLFAKQPFLPPCLVVALLSLLAMINSSFMMVETHPRLRKQPKQAPEIARVGADTPPGHEKTPVSMFAKAHPLPEGGQTSSTEEPPSPMLRRLSSGLDTGREEARQLLRKASNRFSGLLSGYRSLSVHSDDFDRHEYVLEMTKSMEPDSARSGTGWEERQGLVPEEPGMPGSLGATPERPKQVPRLALGRMQSIGTPRTPRRFVFGQSCPEGGQQPLSSSRSSVKGTFGSWKKSADYSALESQEVTRERADNRRAALDEAFAADSSEEEDRWAEGTPMLTQADSAAVRAKLSFEEPGQSGLQDWVGDQHIPVSPQPSGQLGHHLPRHRLREEQEQQNGDVASIKQEFEGEGEAEDDALLGPRKPWYRQRSLQLVLAGYASIAFLMNFLEELTPIFASAPYTSGGLGLTPDQIALPVSFAGVALVLFALLAYPRIQKSIGCMNCAKLGLILGMILALAIPMSSLAAPNFVAIQLCLVPTMGFKAICSIMCMTSSMILVNVTSPIEDIGPVNGFGNMLAAGMRALGPALAGQLWALSIAVVDHGNQFAAFGVVASAFLCTRILYGRMRI